TTHDCLFIKVLFRPYLMFATSIIPMTLKTRKIGLATIKLNRYDVQLTLIVTTACVVINRSFYFMPIYVHHTLPRILFHSKLLPFIYFFNLANASANALFLNPSSCFFKYLLTSFLDTLCFF